MYQNEDFHFCLKPELARNKSIARILTRPRISLMPCYTCGLRATVR